MRSAIVVYSDVLFWYYPIESPTWNKRKTKCWQLHDTSYKNYHIGGWKGAAGILMMCFAKGMLRLDVSHWAMYTFSNDHHWARDVTGGILGLGDAQWAMCTFKKGRDPFQYTQQRYIPCRARRFLIVPLPVNSYAICPEHVNATCVVSNNGINIREIKTWNASALWACSMIPLYVGEGLC